MDAAKAKDRPETHSGFWYKLTSLHKHLPLFFGIETIVSLMLPLPDY